MTEPATSSPTSEPTTGPDHRSWRERRHAGKVLRRAVPRSVHGEWAPDPDRPDPVSMLEAQGRTRVPELLPIRYGRMAASPFGFLRGAAAVMAWDLSRTPSTGLSVQACGDAHLANFGVFATPERRLVFDVNDFDETLAAPWEWDVKRLAASAVVAGREHGWSEDTCREAVLHLSASYRDQFRRLSEMRTLDVWYEDVDAEAVLQALQKSGSTKAAARAEKGFTKARRHTNLHATAGLTAEVDGERRIVDRPPLVEHVHDDDAEGRIAALWADYRASLGDELQRLLDRFRFVDAARKVVGVGSVGTRCWVALYVGGADDDPLVLQVKEAEASVLSPYLAPSGYATHGERVVHGQRFMQAAGDPFLGWTVDRPAGVTYYVRQLQDMKGSVDERALGRSGFVDYLALCAWALARAHARSGDAAVISGYLGTGDAFDSALARFARAYADQTERDHGTLLEAIRAGRIEAEDA